jgi:hypothetical protein
LSNQGANRRSAVPAGQPHRGRDWVSGPNHRGTDNGRALPARACGVLKPIAEKIIIVVSYHEFALCPAGISRVGRVSSCGKKNTCGAYVFTRMICELATRKDLVPCHRLIMGVSSLDFQTPFRRGFFFWRHPSPIRAGGLGVALPRNIGALFIAVLSMKSGLVVAPAVSPKLRLLPRSRPASWPSNAKFCTRITRKTEARVRSWS